MAFGDAEPLLDEMLTCVSLVPAPKERPHVTIPIDDESVEEVSTLLHLRDEIIKIHTGFSIAASLSKLKDAAMSSMGLQDTPTSQSPAES